MGGIAGVFSSESGEVRTGLLQRMTAVLRHRGPDDEGYILVETSSGRCEPRTGDDSAEESRGEMPRIAAPVGFSADLGLGYRRLSIVDLSAAGHQPMSNEDGTVWVVHNGEVYNFVTLREELKSRGHRFRSNTDTEVVLHSYEEWGADCLHRFDGMWAFVLWDARERKLFCSRDRFGVKPLYYFFDGRRFLFASEIKAILEADFVEREANGQAVFDFLVHWAEDCGEETFFRGIRRVPAGHYLEFRPREGELKCVCYYRVPLENGLPGLRDEEYAERFRSLFEDSVRLCLGGDVPVGACLSGGLDSSSIVCTIDRLAREETSRWPGLGRAVRTFSARFDDGRHDEGRFISGVEDLTSADATYVRPTGASLLRELEALIWHQEEPFIATSTYAKWEVLKLAHLSGSKVCVDGQGGDELLAGYCRTHAVLFAYLLSTFQLRQLAGEACAHVRLRGKTGLADLPKAAYHLLPRSVRPRVRAMMRTDGDSHLNEEFAAAFTGYPFRDEYVVGGGASLLDRHLYQMFAMVGLPALLRHEDRSSMAHSLEYRAPFLDHRLVEFVFALPWDQKIRCGTRKYVLRNAMRDILPDAVAGRQDKIGLDTPEDTWLRGELRGLLTEVMNSPSFGQRPYLDGAKARRVFKDFLEGRRTRGANIWGWLCLELWLRRFIDGTKSPVA